MGISHEYHSAHSRAKRSRAGFGLRLAGVIAAILILSLAITAILENGQKESEEAQEAASSGMAENILAPLPMQGAANSAAGESGTEGSADSTGDAGAAAVTLEQFGPARQTAGAQAHVMDRDSRARAPRLGTLGAPAIIPPALRARRRQRLRPSILARADPDLAVARLDRVNGDRGLRVLNALAGVQLVVVLVHR